jgi:acetyl-CoA carboxylase biotin carboxyl carrier protein
MDNNSNQFTVKSPMVGTYYKAPQPGAKPFVAVGDRVRKGDVVCLIEVMKLINSVITDVDGVVDRIHVEDGQAVEHNQPLISIRQN